MKKMVYIRNNIIIILCITIIFMGIGFILLSINLNNEKTKKDNFDVSFTSIDKKSSIMGSNIEPIGNAKIIENSSEIDMSFTMNSIHDELVYIATIENKGTISAKIVDIIESPDYKLDSFNKMINPISITLSDVKGKVILPGESIELKIIVYYNPSDNEVRKKTFQYKIGLITKSI